MSLLGDNDDGWELENSEEEFLVPPPWNYFNNIQVGCFHYYIFFYFIFLFFVIL
jgi:hypothetical protein